MTQSGVNATKEDAGQGPASVRCKERGALGSLNFDAAWFLLRDLGDRELEYTVLE
jgi:hypothetical protein